MLTVMHLSYMQIVEAVKPYRDSMDACLIFPSMPAVMKLNKLGTFSMAQLGQSKSVFSDFIKSARQNNDNFEEGLLKLVRTLPKVLKFLPTDKARDARNFVNSLQVRLRGSIACKAACCTIACIRLDPYGHMGSGCMWMCFHMCVLIPWFAGCL